MSEWTSANAAQLVIDRYRSTRFTTVWKPPPQAGKHRVTCRIIWIPTPPTLTGMIPKPGDCRFMSERPSTTAPPSVIETARSVKGTHVLGTRLGMNMRRNTKRATFSVSPSRWDRSCRATVVSSHPFDLTMASKTCLYWSQLVNPLNLGTYVVLNEAGLGLAGWVHVAGVGRAGGANFSV